MLKLEFKFLIYNIKKFIHDIAQKIRISKN